MVSDEIIINLLSKRLEAGEAKGARKKEKERRRNRRKKKKG